MAIALEKLDAPPVQDDKFSASFVQWVTNLADSINHTFGIIPQVATVQISSAELLDLATTPVTLLPAIEGNRVLKFLSAQLVLDYNSSAYTESGDNLVVRYTDGSGVIVSEDIEMTGFIDQTEDMLTNAIAKKDTIVAATGAASEALVLHNTGSNWAAGNSNLTVIVLYQIILPGL